MGGVRGIVGSGLVTHLGILLECICAHKSRKGRYHALTFLSVPSLLRYFSKAFEFFSKSGSNFVFLSGEGEFLVSLPHGLWIRDK